MDILAITDSQDLLFTLPEDHEHSVQETFPDVRDCHNDPHTLSLLPCTPVPAKRTGMERLIHHKSHRTRLTLAELCSVVDRLSKLPLASLGHSFLLFDRFSSHRLHESKEPRSLYRNNSPMGLSCLWRGAREKALIRHFYES